MEIRSGAKQIRRRREILNFILGHWSCALYPSDTYFSSLSRTEVLHLESLREICAPVVFLPRPTDLSPGFIKSLSIWFFESKVGLLKTAWVFRSQHVWHRKKCWTGVVGSVKGSACQWRKNVNIFVVVLLWSLAASFWMSLKEEGRSCWPQFHLLLTEPITEHLTFARWVGSIISNLHKFPES